MTARMKNPAMVLPDALKGIQNIYKAMYQGGVAHTTMELVHLRVSQINGCSACVHAGIASARRAGETVDRLHSVVAWREADCFTAAERAALAMAEAATRIADGRDGVSDEMWKDASEHYDEAQLSAIILMMCRGVRN